MHDAHAECAIVHTILFGARAGLGWPVLTMCFGYVVGLGCGFDGPLCAGHAVRHSQTAVRNLLHYAAVFYLGVHVFKNVLLYLLHIY